MRAAVYYKNSDVRLEDVPRPEAGPGQLLVKVISSGVCGTDVLEWYRIKKAPIILGHEIAGIVEEVGDEKKINATLELLRPFGILEIVRTGKVAIQTEEK